jgi:hypothetical protein
MFALFSTSSIGAFLRRLLLALQYAEWRLVSVEYNGPPPGVSFRRIQTEQKSRCTIVIITFPCAHFPVFWLLYIGLSRSTATIGNHRIMASLEDLASVISSKSSKISSILKENSIPTPSFNEESFADFEEIPGSNVYHESLRVTRNELISAAQDIIRLAMGPVDHLLSLAWSVSLISNLPSLGPAPL